jgi:EpsI family protein
MTVQASTGDRVKANGSRNRSEHSTVWKTIDTIARRCLVVGLITTIAAVAVYQVKSIESLENRRLANFPNVIEGWSGRDIPLEPWVLESLETPYAIMREYRSLQGHTVNLAIVWYDDKEIAFHSPDDCLGGYGNHVKSMSEHVIHTGSTEPLRVGRIVAERSSEQLLVLYYFINDGFVTPSQMELRRRVLWQRMALKRSSAAFVRVMIPAGKDLAIVQTVLENFVISTLPSIDDATHTNKIKSEQK